MTRKEVFNRIHLDTLLVLKCTKLDGLINEFQGILGLSFHISDGIREFSPCLVEMILANLVIKLVQHFTDFPVSSSLNCPLKRDFKLLSICLQATVSIKGKQGLHTNSGKCLALHNSEPCFDHQIAILSLFC